MVHGLSKASLWCLAAAFAFAFAAARGQQVPCYFVFGDSVFDNGNNNYLNTLAKVNYSPYGVSFPDGPTGRFSNGRNIPDFLAELLGFKNHIPPFAGASTAQINTGVNYASGGAGIRSESGRHLGERHCLGTQIKNHRSAIEKAAVSRERLHQCLYTINIGSNDYINNYFMPPPYDTHLRYNPDQFAEALIRQYAADLRTLYGLGARKVAVFGISKIGCIPRMIASHGGGKGCATEVNAAADLFNQKLRAQVTELNRSHAGANFTFITLGGGNATAIAALGFTTMDKSCCTVEPGKELCKANGPVCAEPNKYIYWDMVHGTEAANKLVAYAAYGGPAGSPYNIQSLVALN